MSEKIKFVCPECLRGDKVLSDWVNASEERGSCSYCGLKNQPVRSANEVANYMFGYIKDVYEASVPSLLEIDGVKYDIVCLYTDTNSMLAEVFDYQGDSGGFASDYRLIGDLADMLRDLAGFGNDEVAWNTKVADPHGEALIGSWIEFAAVISYRRRFLFLASMEAKDKLLLPRHSALEILKILGEELKERGLRKNVEKGKMVYRVRVAKNGEVFDDVKDLGAPSAEKAAAGRMNPPGIPYFYAAFDQLTACAEVCSDAPSVIHVAYISAWQTRKDLEIIDLSSLGECPSFFDRENIQNRAGHRFLQEFIATVCRPLPAGDVAQLAYIPAQVVSEYFRTVLHVDGVVFRSTRNPTGKCVVLFPSEESDVFPYPFGDMLKLCKPVEKKLVGFEPDLVIPKLKEKNSFDPWELSELRRRENASR
ncbi:RES domain-containing protein [Ferriphaselus amnicola]|uniref:RES domain-containing protein n=1 Tax=Ferriphaselus amnicola TaxID=1188319 RepID=A0A2Z6GBY1_9PROT|nr:RES domain-containing protein [Ferriphaselus amnicola]BBE50947.1 RES domain-containing protein [Ferriphaselus amnicola]